MLARSKKYLLQIEEFSLSMEFLEADKDPGNQEIKKDFASFEGEDFIDLDDMKSE